MSPPYSIPASRKNSKNKLQHRPQLKMPMRLLPYPPNKNWVCSYGMVLGLRGGGRVPVGAFRVP
eukprot:3940883-Rhodomonas_salina.3